MGHASSFAHLHHDVGALVWRSLISDFRTGARAYSLCMSFVYHSVEFILAASRR